MSDNERWFAHVTREHPLIQWLLEFASKQS